MEIKRVLTDATTRRNGRWSLRRLRNALADRVDKPLLAVHVLIEEHISGVLLVQWDYPTAVWSGDGFGKKPATEGLLAYISATSLLSLFAVPSRRCDHGALTMSIGRLAAGEIEGDDEVLLADFFDYSIEQFITRSDFGVPRNSEPSYVAGMEAIDV